MKVLVAMPCVNNTHVTKECLDSIVNHPVDILLCQNGATDEIKELFKEYKEKHSTINTIWNIEENKGLNPVFNDFMYYFLIQEQYTHLAIINSDIILHSNWLNIIKRAINIHGDLCYLPTEVDKEKIFQNSDLEDLSYHDIEGGACGMIMWLSREHVKAVYPMPTDIKIWFGDNWIFDLYRGVGGKTVVLKNFWCFHHGSSTLKTLSSTSQWIEDDKIAWRDVVKPELERRIEIIKKQMKNETLD